MVCIKSLLVLLGPARAFTACLIELALTHPTHKNEPYSILIVIWKLKIYLFCFCFSFFFWGGGEGEWFHKHYCSSCISVSGFIRDEYDYY